ncbi:hypothetical protein AB0I91_34935 [Actinosynnema sp. NPDC049800]
MYLLIKDAHLRAETMCGVENAEDAELETALNGLADSWSTAERLVVAVGLSVGEPWRPSAPRLVG